MTLAFFRRHKKWFMALMVLAVVSMMFFQAWPYLPKIRVWLFGGSTGPAIVRIQGRDVTDSELQDFYSKMVLAGSFSHGTAIALMQQAQKPETSGRWYRATLGATSMMHPRLPDPSLQDYYEITQTFFAREASVTAIATWMAFYQEAVEAGLQTPEGQVEQRLSELEALGMPASELTKYIKQRADGRRATLVQALQIDMTMRAYIDFLQLAMGGAVGPEVRAQFARTDNRIQVSLAVLRAYDFLTDIPADLPDADLMTTFKDNKAFLAGQGKDGFGYRIPDQVSLEYLVADPAAFEAKARTTITEDDIRKYYETNKDPEFIETAPLPVKPAEPLKPATPEKAAPKSGTTVPETTGAKAPAPVGPKGDSGTQGPTTAAPSTTTTGAATPSVTTTGAATPNVTTSAAATPPATTSAPPPEKKFLPFDQVRETIRLTLIQKEASRQAQDLLTQDVIAIRRAGHEPLDFWADNIQVRLGIVKNLVTEKELEMVPGLGSATRNNRSLPADALSLKELGVEKAAMAVGEISDPYVAPSGKAYAFRVTACVKNHEPATLAEVRSQVLADVRKTRAFELAREDARKLLELAETQGADGAVKGLHAAVDDMAGTLGVGRETTHWWGKWFEPRVKAVDSGWVTEEMVFPFRGEIMRIGPVLPEVGRNRIVVSECFRMAAESKKFSRVVVADQDMAVVVELLGHKGPRQAEYEKQRATLALLLGAEIGQKAVRDAAVMEAIQKRMKVEKLVESDEFRPPRQSRNADDTGDF
jgi:hypothetical protein